MSTLSAHPGEDLVERSRLARSTLRLFDARSAAYHDQAKALANSLMADYNVSRSVETLEQAISVNEEALLYCLTEQEGRAELLEDLGVRLYTLCRQHSCRDTRASRCIEVLREALEMRPVGHASRSHSLHRLAKALFFVSYDYLGNRKALDEAIVLTRESLHLFPGVHPERDDALNTLACALRRDFEYSGDLDVLAECIESHREALLLRLPGHPLRDRTLNNLSTALLCSFEHQGGFDVLAEAISLCRQALQLRPVGHPLRWSALENLGISLYVRVNVVDHGQTEILAEAVCHQREAVELLPSTHSKRGEALLCLANSLVATFRCEGSLHSLAEAITLYRSVVGMYPPDHPDHDELLAKFAEALKLDFNLRGDATTLSEAVTLHQEALEARPPGHPQRLESLVSLADLHLMTETRSWADARRLYEEALEICPAGYPVRARLLSNMSRCFLDRDSPFFRPAIGLRHLTAGYADQFSHINQRLRSAVSDLRNVEDAYDRTLGAFDASEQEEHIEEVLHLYVQVIGLLPRAANFGLDSDARLRAVSGSDEIARNAAGRALALERVSQAVEMLEQGRGVFWSQSLHLRATGFDDLPSEERRELLRLLRLLEQGARRLESADQTTAQRERDLEFRRQLNGEAEALISRVRAYTGLERFLLPPAFDALLGALPRGYVVIVNVSRLGHHALLLCRDNDLAASLELKPPRIVFDSAALLAQLPRDASAEMKQDAGIDAMRAMRLVRNRTHHVDDALAILWTSIVQPIISKLDLQKKTRRDRPRLWWCVTGELGFLPIHAAGDYRSVGQTFTADYVVSSYIPTLSALTKARDGWKPVPRRELGGLLICETSADDSSARYLPNAAEEVHVVRECFESTQVRVLNAPSVHHTRSQLRALLDDTPAHILHLACHGLQDSNPLKSAILLQDGRLTIKDIMELNLSHAVLAFLSACQTAKGDKNAPDQAVHLAASMLFCGFRSVIGTMWLMHDADGPTVARSMYDALFKHDDLDLDDIPYALDDAVQALRRSGVPAARWALYMHIGG